MTRSIRQEKRYIKSHVVTATGIKEPFVSVLRFGRVIILGHKTNKKDLRRSGLQLMQVLQRNYSCVLDPNEDTCSYILTRKALAFCNDGYKDASDESDYDL